MLVEVLVHVDVIGGKHDRAPSSLNSYELRCVGVFSAGIAGDSWKDSLIVAFHEVNAAFHVHLHVRKDIVFIDSAVRLRSVPTLSGVVRVLVSLDPDTGVRK